MTTAIMMSCGEVVFHGTTHDTQRADMVTAMRTLEGALEQSMQRPESATETAAVGERLVLLYNTAGVAHTHSAEFTTARGLLTAALALTEPGASVFAPAQRQRLRGATLNNLGCLERKCGDTASAVRYLQSALEHDGRDSPSTVINLAVAFTQQRRFAEAAQLCRHAIAILERGGVEAARATLIVAYHNLGCALEPNDTVGALLAHRRAVELSREHYGAADATTQELVLSLNRVISSHNMGAVDDSRKSGQHAQFRPTPPLAFAATPPFQAFTAHQMVPRRPASSGGIAATPRPRRLVTSGMEKQSVAESARPHSAVHQPRKRNDTSLLSPFAGGQVQSAVSVQENGGGLYMGGATARATSPLASGSGSLGASNRALGAHRAVAAAHSQREAQSVNALVLTLANRLGALVRVEEDFERRYDAAVRIQCLARRRAATHLAATLREDRRCTAVLHRLRLQVSARRVTRFMRVAAVSLRRHREMHASAAAINARRATAATLLQMFCRGVTSARVAKRRAVRGWRQEAAVRSLQRWWRRTSARVWRAGACAVRRDIDRSASEALETAYASGLLQRAARGFSIRLAAGAAYATMADTRERRRLRATIAIQAGWRAYAGRRAYCRLLKAHEDEVTRLRRYFALYEAAVCLQAAARGMCVRRAYAPEISRRREAVARLAGARRSAAATRINALVRGFLARRRASTLRAARAIVRHERLRVLHASTLGAFALAALASRKRRVASIRAATIAAQRAVAAGTLFAAEAVARAHIDAEASAGRPVWENLQHPCPPATANFPTVGDWLEECCPAPHGPVDDTESQVASGEASAAAPPTPTPPPPNTIGGVEASTAIRALVLRHSAVTVQRAARAWLSACAARELREAGLLREYAEVAARRVEGLVRRNATDCAAARVHLARDVVKFVCAIAVERLALAATASDAACARAGARRAAEARDDASARRIQGATRRHRSRSNGRDAIAARAAERFTSAVEADAAACEEEREEAARCIQAGARVWAGRRSLRAMRAERQRFWMNRAAEEDSHANADVDF